jgi:hypothetical protein
MGTGSITPAQLERASEVVNGSSNFRDAAVTGAQLELLTASQQPRTEQEEHTRRAITLCMFYIAQSDTLKVVRARYRHCHGHWMTLLYRFKDGRAMIRPAFKSTVIGAERMSEVLIKRWGADILAEDTTSEFFSQHQLSRVLHPSEAARNT